MKAAGGILPLEIIANAFLPFVCHPMFLPNRKNRICPKHLITCVLATLCAGVVLTGVAQAEPRPVAVLVGNSQYFEEPLLHCATDAQALAGRLEEMGFRVITHTNASLNDLRRAVHDLERESAQGGLALFYFAGHAFQVDDENYLSPIGPIPDSAGEVKSRSLHLGEVFGALERSGTRGSVVILDAARPHPLRKRLGLAPGLAHVSAPAGTYLAFSTKPGTHMIGRHDHAYAKVLIEHLADRDASIPRLFGQVKLKVRQRTGEMQQPWDANALVERVYLMPQRDTDGRLTRFLAPPSAHAQALPGGEEMNPRPVFALASASIEALAAANAGNSGDNPRPEGAQLDLPLRGSGALWEKVFHTRRGRVNLLEGGTIYAHPSRQSQPLTRLPAGTKLHVVGYVRTREGLFWLPLTRYQEYMQGGDPAWIFIHGSENTQDFAPHLLVDSTVPDIPAPSPDAEEPVAATVPGRPGFVYSPFVNNRNYVDVRGYTPGARVRCPYTGLVFRVP